jgi:uncharacterized protein
MAWILSFLGLYLIILLGISWISLHPFRIPLFVSPGSMGAPQEEVVVESDGLRLRGWWVEAEGADRVVVLAHGYMMNRAELTPVAQLLWRHGISCLLIDLRAHGKSQGKQSYLGLREATDVREAVRWAKARVPGAKVGVLGSSMGAAAAAIAVGEEPGLIDLLVLDSAYCRLSSAVLGWWRFVGGNLLSIVLSPTVLLAAPMAGFNPFRVDVSRYLARGGAIPVLFLHGDSDNLALPAEAERNKAACTGTTELVWFPGCGHSEGRWEQFERYNSALLGFLWRSEFLKVDPFAKDNAY